MGGRECAAKFKTCEVTQDPTDKSKWIAGVGMASCSEVATPKCIGVGAGIKCYATAATTITDAELKVCTTTCAKNLAHTAACESTGQLCSLGTELCSFTNKADAKVWVITAAEDGDQKGCYHGKKAQDVIRITNCVLLLLVK